MASWQIFLLWWPVGDKFFSALFDLKFFAMKDCTFYASVMIAKKKDIELETEI